MKLINVFMYINCTSVYYHTSQNLKSCKNMDPGFKDYSMHLGNYK